MGGIFAIVVFHTNTGLTIDRSNEESDGELGYLEFHILQFQWSSLTDVLANHSQLINKLDFSRQAVVSGNLRKRIVLMVQRLVKIFAHLLQELFHRLFSNRCTQSQGVDKHTHGVADEQVGTTA